MIQLTNDSLPFYRADAAYYSGDRQDGGVGHGKVRLFCKDGNSIYSVLAGGEIAENRRCAI